MVGAEVHVLALAVNSNGRQLAFECPVRSVARSLSASFALCVCLCGSSRAQIIFGNFVPAIAVDANVSGAKPESSFSLPSQSNDVKDALDEFRRMVKHEQWEKAFKSVELIAGKTSSGFIDRGDSVMVPSGLLVRGLLASLPSAGKSAYRLFYDSQAQALWDKAVDKAEADCLSAIVANHLISSVGDRAADRLGDLHFEAGNLDQAVTAWRSLAEYCPDSKLPKAQVLIKIAMALARSGRWNEFHEIERTVRDRFVSDTVEIGGRRLSASEQLAELAALQQSERVAEESLSDDFELPSDLEPAWQFRFQSKADPLNTNQPFAMQDIYGRQVINDFVIPAVADETRVYVNTFGVQMAFDAQTGKLVWRSGKLHQLQFSQARQQAAPDRYSLTLFGGRTWSVERDPQQQNQSASFALVVREAATGKEVFNTRRSLSMWNILGEPYLADDVVYVGASRTGQGSELALLVLNANDGKLVRTVTVGKYSVDQNSIYSERVAQPTFLLHRGRLFVDTHAGALVSMQPQTGQLDWGLMYDSPAPPAGQYYYNYVPPRLGVGRPLRAGDLLFTKGMRSARLLGVHIDGPGLEWNRPVGKESVIVGADQDRIYMAGEELAAYSLKTKELLWVSPLPRSANWSLPRVSKTRLYQFTSRGVCEVDKLTGDVRKIFRGVDLDSYGGTLLVTPKTMVTVSNLAVTAYSRGAADRDARAN